MSISSSFLSNASDVFLTTGSVFNLNFGGSDTIRSLFVDGTPQPIGTYGAADLGGLLITGGGTLTVTEVPVIGLDGDHNADGVVDAADYVAWRKDPDNFGGDPAGYNDWVANFGESQLGSGNEARAGARGRSFYFACHRTVRNVTPVSIRQPRRHDLATEFQRLGGNYEE